MFIKVKKHNYSDGDINKNEIHNSDRKVFDRGVAHIKPGNFGSILDESMFYNPNKKPVPFKSPDGKSKVFSKDIGKL